MGFTNKRNDRFFSSRKVGLRNRKTGLLLFLHPRLYKCHLWTLMARLSSGQDLRLNTSEGCSEESSSWFMVVLVRMNASAVKTFLYIKMALRLYLCLLIVEQVPFLVMVLGHLSKAISCPSCTSPNDGAACRDLCPGIKSCICAHACMCQDVHVREGDSIVKLG